MNRISNRPRRYEICELREDDMDMIFVDMNTDLKPHYPVRVVLTNQTFSVFTGEIYETNY
jgi:hypothetical protein